MSLFSHDTSPNLSPIFPIPPADSLVSPLTHPPAVDPVLDQTPDLPPTTLIAHPLAVDPVLDQTLDLPLAAPLADSLVSPQEPTPPVDLVTNQTPPLPLRRSNLVRVPSAHLRDFVFFNLI